MTADFFSVSDFIEHGLGSRDSKITIGDAVRISNGLLRERSKKVYGRKDSRWWDDHEPGFCDDGAEKVITQGPKNMSALLICVEPIARDSAEKIVEDLLQRFEKWPRVYELIEFLDRARALKGGK